MNAANFRSTANFRFHHAAIVVGALGAAIGLIASVVAWRLQGQFPATTFQASLLTLVVVCSVFRDDQRLKLHAGTRENDHADCT